MKLTDCDPTWWKLHDSPRHGIGITFDCPLCVRDKVPEIRRGVITVAFRQPLDGGPALVGARLWDRHGSTFENLTLTPSLDASSLNHVDENGKTLHAGWHGHVTEGRIVGGL